MNVRRTLENKIQRVSIDMKILRIFINLLRGDKHEKRSPAQARGFFIAFY